MQNTVLSERKVIQITVNDPIRATAAMTFELFRAGGSEPFQQIPEGPAVWPS